MEEFTKNWLDIHLIHQTDFNTLFKNWKNDV